MEVAGIGWLPWRSAVVTAVALLLLTLTLRRFDRTRAASRTTWEVALILALYAAWQYAGSLSHGDLEQARESGLWLAQVEAALRWPTEVAIQSPILGHDALMGLADAYYSTVHAPVFLITLAWVLAIRRADWPFVRTVVVLLTGTCLLIQFRPVAPPRLIPQLGVVDTALAHGRSVYTAVPEANQLSAMPSVHIAWAAAVALIIIVVARTPWRWLALAYPVLTLWVVVVTGNHFIIDGVVAVLLLAVTAGVAVAIPSQRPTRLIERIDRSCA